MVFDSQNNLEKKMRPKERVLATIECREVDRTPGGLFGTHSDYLLALQKLVGVGSCKELYHHLGIDVIHINGLVPKRNDFFNTDGVPIDAWGKPIRQKDDNHDGFSNESRSVFTEESTFADVEKHRFPTSEDFYDDGSFELALNEYKDFCIEAGPNNHFFHIFLNLCGFEGGLMMLYTKPELAKLIIKRCMDSWIDLCRFQLEIAKGRIDIVRNCNDFGSQRSMLVSEDIFCEFFRPELQRLYKVIKDYGAKVMQHSCGAVAPLIPHFIEMGADIINPIQVAAEGMDVNELAKQYSGKVCFYGGIDTQFLLPEASPAEVVTKAKELMSLFDRGLILSGSQGLMEDIPYKNTLALFSAGERLKI